MSDIGIDFPLWAVIGFGLAYALPVTTLVLAALCAAWLFARRRSPGQRLAALKLGILVVGPLWLAGLGFGSVMLVNELHARKYGAEHYFTTQTTRLIDGIEIPAQSRVALDEGGALQSIELADGSTVAIGGTRWRGRIDFTPPSNASGAARGQIDTATLADAAVIQGIPCHSGKPVVFFWDGELMRCTLSEEASLPSAIADRSGGMSIEGFACAAEREVELFGRPYPQLSRCVLAQPIEVAGVACAGGAEIRLDDAHLTACTLAKPTRLGQLDLPAGSFIAFYQGRPSRFELPLNSGPVNVLGLDLPPGSEGALCSPEEKLAGLDVLGTDYVAIGGVELTGHIAFECGEFLSGTLFGDTVVHKQPRRAGTILSRDDLFPASPN